MAEGITLKRIIDMDEATELSSSDYALVDSATGGPKKFALGEELSSLKEELGDISAMQTATTSDVGKALKAKTVEDGKVTAWEFGETGATTDIHVEGTALVINTKCGRWK